jgi:hypothetical protein
MDNNNPTQPPVESPVVPPAQPPTTTPLPTDPAATPVTPTPAVAPATTTPPASNKFPMKWVLIGVAVILVIVIFVLGFLMMSRKQAEEAPVGSGVDVSDLETEANALGDENIDSDFQELDTELQNL